MNKVFKGEDIRKGVVLLDELMGKSMSTVVFTGAGMDTESNIPDFRGKDGWWKNIDPRLVASIDTFHENYTLFQEFYSMRLKLLEDIKPHEGHYVLADLQKRGIIKSIVTQNVAGLHQIAGSKKVYELHGSIKTVRCNNCNHDAKLEDFLNKKSCTLCGKNLLRPDVVLFGEALPSKAWALAEKDINNCDLLIVIGTSLEVYPANQFPRLAKGKTVLINYEDIGFDYEFDIKLIGKAKEVLEELSKILREIST